MVPVWAPSGDWRRRWGALTLEKTQMHSHNKLKSKTKTKINRKPEAKCGSEMLQLWIWNQYTRYTLPLQRQTRCRTWLWHFLWWYYFSVRKTFSFVLESGTRLGRIDGSEKWFNPTLLTSSDHLPDMIILWVQTEYAGSAKQGAPCLNANLAGLRGYWSIVSR